MTPKVTYAAALLVLLAATAFAATPAQFAICPRQMSGHTSDQPPDPVVVCQQLFPAPPYVHLPADRHLPDGSATINGVVELDINSDKHIAAARLYDRNLMEYALVNTSGKPIDETSPLMKKTHLPSNRVHFLIYEATGKVAGNSLQLTGRTPSVLVAGSAIDSRFLGAWEGLVSKRKSETQWYTDERQPQNFAKIRVMFAPPLLKMDNIGELGPKPFLPDGTRSKAIGTFENATQKVRLSTGECAPALNSYGAANPFPARVAVTDYFFHMWRFPAMHSLWSKDFHVVTDYPKNLYPNPGLNSMASNHNFRLKDYIAVSTAPMQLRFGLHGNPVDQIVFLLKPVTGGGGTCQ
jgi:hypothetical protein